MIGGEDHRGLIQIDGKRKFFAAGEKFVVEQSRDAFSGKTKSKKNDKQQVCGIAVAGKPEQYNEQRRKQKSSTVRKLYSDKFRKCKKRTMNHHAKAECTESANKRAGKEVAYPTPILHSVGAKCIGKVSERANRGERTDHIQGDLIILCYKCKQDVRGNDQSGQLPKRIIDAARKHADALYKQDFWNCISKIREETDGMKQIGRLERNKKDEKGQQIIRVDPL